jgi:EpsI family protein
MTAGEASVAEPGRRQITRRSMALGVGFAVTAGIAAAVTPRRHEQSMGGARLDDVVPTRAGPYQAGEAGPLILPEQQQLTDVYDQVLTRTYAAQGLPMIMLLIAYGAAQSGLMTVHRPEVCYASAGFSIRNDRPTDIPLGLAAPVAAKGFLAVRQDRVEQVLYWTRISDAFPRNINAQRLVMLERGLSGVIPDGVLVRYSTLGADLAAQPAMKSFARALVASAGPVGRSLLVGAPLRPEDRG